MNPDSDATLLSVAIITLNEEARLAHCLQSLPRGSEVVVLDSGSTDGTEAAARRFGARFERRTFTDYADQKNAALELATRPWVLSLDADEVLTPELRADVARVTARTDDPVAGYRLTRQLVFMGRRLRFGKATDHPVRLVRKGQARFSSAIHERLEVSGAVGQLAGALLHYSYDDLSDYFRRFNDYTTKIAANHARQGRGMPPLALHLLRPWSEFVVRYFFRLGVLDGYPGYTYALLSSFYTYVKYAKLKERLLLASDQT